MSRGTVAVIVPSYNRPRMLREALGSLAEADEVWIADDGSEFDVRALAAEYGVPGERVLRGPAMTPEQRLRHSNCGKLVNVCLRTTTADYVAYCCDDDLLAPGWLPAVAAALDADQRSHMVRGDWRRFNDGESVERSELCQPTFDFSLTTGNFAHRVACASGCGCWWPEDTVTCHDAGFLGRYLQRHGATDIRHVGVLAGYRREHPTNMIRWTRLDGRSYRPEVAELFAAGRLD